jgi:hypothetical protein
MDIVSDLAGGSQNGIPDSAKSAIDGITADIGSKRGETRGRKKGSVPWNKGRANGVATPQPSVASEPAQPITEEQLEFVRASVAQAMQVASNYCTNSVYSKVLSVSTQLEPEAKRFADGVLIPPAEIDLVSGAAKAIAVNHPFLVNYAPYAIVIGWFGTYAMRYLNVQKEIKLLRIAVEKLKGVGVQNTGEPIVNASTPQTH